MSNKIFVDLDGVLADFGAFKDKFDVSTHDFFTTILPKYPDLFYNLKLCPGASSFMSQLNFLSSNENVQIEILTAVPHRNLNPKAAFYKTLWVKKYFPYINVINCVQGGYVIDGNNEKVHMARINKASYVQMSNDILIDDDENNIDHWKARGGIGILHKGDFDKTLNTIFKYFSVE